MLLFANGCSHTAGAEIEFPMQGECYDKAWPKHLANIWGCDHVNLSKSGGSQKRIIRTTINFIGNYLLEGKDLKDIFVIILWPGPYRTELFDPSFPTIYGDGWRTFCVGNDYKNISKDMENFYKSWVLAYDNETAKVTNLLDVISLQSYLKFWKIKYFFFRASSTQLSTRDSHQPLAAQIDERLFPGAWRDGACFTDLLDVSPHNFSEFSRFRHYGEDGHKYFATVLDKMIKKAHNI